MILPQQPPRVGGREILAWYEYDPATGFIEGVMASGRRGAMTEYVIENVIMDQMVAQGIIDVAYESTINSSPVIIEHNIFSLPFFINNFSY